MDTEKIVEWLKEKYELGQVSVSLLRSYTNDVYLVETPKEKFVLKIYGKEWRSEEEVWWEIELLNYLVGKGISVAGVKKSKDGSELNKLDEQLAVLFEFAPGDKPKPPFSLDLQYKVGQAAAKLHQAMDGFESSHERSVLATKHLIDESLEIWQAQDISSKDKEMLTSLGNFLKEKIEGMEGLDFGPVHGDLTLDNLHVTSDGEIIFYDFDSSGVGYRGMELYGWVVLNPDKKEVQEAFLKGYQEVRDVAQQDLDAVPYLQAAQDMWLKKGMKALSSPEILEGQLKRLKEWSNYWDI